MKKALLIFSKVFVTIILTITEIVFIYNMFFNMSINSQIINILFRILGATIIIYIINNTKHLSRDLSWIIFIVLFPVLGGVTYFIIYRRLFSNKYFKRINKIEHDTKKYLKQDKTILNEIKDTDKNAYSQISYLSSYNNYPIYQNSEYKYYPLGELAFEKMLEELKKAKKFIFMEYFIYEKGIMWNSILEILKEKVKEGVEVRVMYDDAGCISTLPKNYDKELEKYGIKCTIFNKITPIAAVFYNNRDHRKILVIDGEVAFSGGINIADEYINKKVVYGHWKDNGFMIKGEAVWNYTVMFLRTWNSFRNEDNDYNKFKSEIKNKNQDGYVLPYGFNPLANELIAENVYLNIINNATDYIYIFTPYLIIDNEIINALGLCAKRGVDVRIVTPGIPDKKIIYNITESYYKILIEQGVKIYEYTPGFIHAKVFVCDDKIATVGTINMDYRSLYLHFECGSLLYNSKEIKEIKKDAIETIEKSKNVVLSNMKTSIFKRILSAILRILAPLL